MGIGQKIYKGHSHGHLVIEKLKDYERESEGVDAGEDRDGIERVEIPFINENLVIEAVYADETKKVHTSLSRSPPPSIFVLFRKHSS